MGTLGGLRLNKTPFLECRLFTGFIRHLAAIVDWRSYDGDAQNLIALLVATGSLGLRKEVGLGRPESRDSKVLRHQMVQ